MKTIQILCITGMLIMASVASATQVNINHFAPIADNLDATSVSVNVNDSEEVSEINFRQSSSYFLLAENGITPGATTFDVFTPPGAVIPAISATIDLAADTQYSISAIGDDINQPLTLMSLIDDNTLPSNGFAKVRIVHAAPFDDTLANTAVSVRTDTGELVNGLSDMEFGEVSAYFELPAGTVDLNVSTPNGFDRLIDLAPFTLNSGDVITFYAIGNGSNQPLGMYATFADSSSADIALEEPFTTLTPGLNGSWSNFDTNGQGFFVEIFPELGTMFVAWFTYDTTFADADEDEVVGDSNHRWYTAQGTYDGTRGDLTLALSTGGIFTQDNAVTTEPAGTLSIEFDDCRSAEVQYSITDSGLSGTIPISRISGSTVEFCESISSQQTE